MSSTGWKLSGWFAVLSAVVLAGVLGSASATAQQPAPQPAPARVEATPAGPAPTVKREPKPDIVLPPTRPAGHGWFTLPAGRDRGTVLFHLPPRVAAGGGDAGPGSGRTPGRNGGTEGLVRLAPGFSQTPQYVAWWHGRVFIALEGDRTAPIGKADWQRRILTLSASKSLTNGLGGWEYPPGRPEVVATLPVRYVDMIGFGACRLGPVALLRHTAHSSWIIPPPSPAVDSEPSAPKPPEPGELELLLYTSAAWHRLELPWSSQPTDTKPAGPFWIVGSSDDLTIFANDAAEPAVRAYTTRLPAMIAGDQRLVPADWSTVNYPLVQRISGTDFTLPEPDLVCRIEGGTVAAAWSADSGGELRLFWLRAGRSAEEGPAVAGVPREHMVVPMDGSSRLAVTWSDPAMAAASGPGSAAPPGAGDATIPEGSPAQRRRERATVGLGSNQTGLQIREISATTGKVLYAGPLRTDNWLSLREYQVLAFMLVLVMGSVIVFVLRAEPAQSPNLPKGVTMAEPGRRFLAAMIDYVPAALLVESLMAIPTGTLLLPSQMASDQFSLWALLAALAVAATHCSVAEALFGRSLGKLMTGCAVASIRPRIQAADATSAATPETPLSRPAAWQCIVRNLVKWAAPMLGLFILFDAGRRHPGDLIARTLVLLTEIDDKT